MAHPSTDLHFPPTISKTFTSFPQTVGGASSVVASLKVFYRPCQLIVVHTTGDALAYTDDGGANTITFATDGVTVLRLAPLTIDAGTTANSVTVNWQGGVMNY